MYNVLHGNYRDDLLRSPFFNDSLFEPYDGIAMVMFPSRVRMFEILAHPWPLTSLHRASRAAKISTQKMCPQRKKAKTLLLGIFLECSVNSENVGV